MSVLECNRTPSKCDFYASVIRIREKLVEMLLNDFVISPASVYFHDNLFMTSDRMTDLDKSAFKELARKYRMRIEFINVPCFILEKFRDNIWHFLTDMQENTVRAYTMYITNNLEAKERRLYQDKAIAACECLIQELRIAQNVLPVKAEKLFPYLSEIEEAIAQLKKWRKQSSKNDKAIVEKAESSSEEKVDLDIKAKSKAKAAKDEKKSQKQE